MPYFQWVRGSPKHLGREISNGLKDGYRTRKHRGLTDAKEKWVTPGDLFNHGPRYEKAPPPREYAAMLLMKADTARVTSQGINKFGVLYDKALNGFKLRYTGSAAHVTVRYYVHGGMM